MAADKIIEALAKLADALKDNSAAESLLTFLSYLVIFLFTYFFIKMIIEKIKDSRTDRVLGKIEATISQNTLALGKVTTALERLER